MAGHACDEKVDIMVREIVIVEITQRPRLAKGLAACAPPIRRYRSARLDNIAAARSYYCPI